MRPPAPSMMVSRRTKIAVSVVAIVIVLLVLLDKACGVYINWSWFGEVGHHQVYSVMLFTKLVLFFVFGAIMTAIIAGNLVIAYVTRPPFRPMSPEQQNLQHWVTMIEPRRKLVLGLVAFIVFVSAGASAQGNWTQWQIWLHPVSWHEQDPLFHRDISFYFVDYPIYRSLLAFGFTAIILSIVFSVVVHYLTGAIRLQTPGPKITVAARRQLTILVFVFMAFKAIAYWLDRYGFVFSERSKFTGASYTDVHSALPAKTILFWIAIVLAVGVLASLWLRSSLLPIIGFVVLLVLSILIGGIYPAIVQQFNVKPNAQTKEMPYIHDNISATRNAYGIQTRSKDHPDGTVDYKPYDVNTTPNQDVLQQNSPTIDNVRILDPNVVSPTFAQQQANYNNVYGFPPRLNVDRYTVDGQEKDYIVGVRELDQASLSGTQTNWINEHTTYTHGYGFVAAAADDNVTVDQNYAYGNIPESGSLESAFPLKNPQVYYGELSPNYVIVGAKGTPREYDARGGKITYQGSGGIPLSSAFTKFAFAVQDRETNFLLNDAVSAPGARVMINRDPRQRVEKVAPFLKIDGDPYPFVDSATGHITWMIDAYTTSDQFPYSERESLSQLTSDSLTISRQTNAQPDDQINYIRNSVKATVDAYTGKVHLYDWDSSDPVLQTWRKIYPGLVQPKSQMPTAVLDHVRYPEDLFTIQRSMLEQYHVSNPVKFYNQTNKWTVPGDPAQGASGNQPPYYVLADSLSGSGGAQFQLTSPMKVNSKSNLAAYMSVSGDAGSDYGRMTILKITNGTIIQGPEQVANTFTSDSQISSFLRLQRQGSAVIDGNLLTLPVGNSFLYVEPIYIRSQNGYPILRQVLVDLGGDLVGSGTTLDEAFADLHGASGNAPSTDNPTPSTSPSTSPSSSPTSTPSTAPSTSTPSSGSPQAQQAQIRSELRDELAQLDDVSKSGNQVAIARVQQQINDLLRQLLAVSTPAGS